MLIEILHERSTYGVIPFLSFFLFFVFLQAINLRYVDLRKAYSVLLGNLYKTLYNIGTRRQAEKDEPGVKAVLEKRERSDVSQDESLLTRMERDVLKEWENKQEKLTVLEMRVEEAVFILRDLGALGIDDD